MGDYLGDEIILTDEFLHNAIKRLEMEHGIKSRSVFNYIVSENVTDNMAYHCVDKLISIGYIVAFNDLKTNFIVNNKFRYAITSNDILIAFNNNNISLDDILRRRKIERLKENIKPKSRFRFRFKLPWK